MSKKKKGKELFNFEKFDIKLNTDFIGRNFVYAEEVDSSNSFLLSKSNSYKKNGTVLLAEKQLKGRGRKDRVWYSAKDQNLTFSILINDKSFLENNFNLINLGASLSIVISINNLFQLQTNLKWPNDIIINRKKTAGILLESISRGSKIERLVVGMGINVNQVFFQGAFNYTPTSINIELKHEVERENLLAEILNNFEDILYKIQTDPKRIINDWKSHCRMWGDRITVEEGKKNKSGIFYDIDDDGFLLLRTDKKIEKIHFGDVFFAE